MMKSKNPNYPQVIQSCLQRIESYIQTLLYARKGIWRAMRIERQQSLLLLMTVLAKHAALAYDGAFVLSVGDGRLVPMTVGSMSKLTNLSRPTVERCLHDLREMEVITTSKQVKRIGADGLECGPVLRKFTKKFWQAIGLYSAFCRAVQYAVAHSKLRISWKFHKIVNKAKKIVSSALAGVAKVPKDENRERYRQNQIFLQYLDCSRKHDCGCIGGYASAEVCAFCRKMRAKAR